VTHLDALPSRTASAIALGRAAHYNGPRVSYTRGVMTFDDLREGDGCQPGAHARDTHLEPSNEPSNNATLHALPRHRTVPTAIFFS
jgi:hypothetical protein